MIEIKRKKHSSDKWLHKYPRAKINNLGGDRKAIKAIKAAGWYNGWWNRNWVDNKDTEKFLRANVGRPVDKVFSEWLERIKKGHFTRFHSNKWKGFFYSFFEEKKDIEWWGGFYLTNGIINYKKRKKSPYNRTVTLGLPNNITLSDGQWRQLCDTAFSREKPTYLGTYYYNKGTDKSRIYVGYIQDIRKYHQFERVYLNNYGWGFYFNQVPDPEDEKYKYVEIMNPVFHKDTSLITYCYFVEKSLTNLNN